MVAPGVTKQGGHIETSGSSVSAAMHEPARAGLVREAGVRDIHRL